ncbi:MAG: carboxypeptidase-like regulatory domain-containing protein [Bacteroidales bacterium]
MNKKILVFLITANLALCGFGQKPEQTIRGCVREALVGTAVPWATIIIEGTDPLMGTTSGEDGCFELSGVPVGRYDIKVTSIGYKPVVIKEVVVQSTRETILEITMEQDVKELEEAVVTAGISKDKPLNSMALVSSRMLSVEEAQRYAGGFDDPARLASAFAGVASNIADNGIVVRGNAPRLLQWRMEGIEIPNPNHFADLNTFGGGGLTALSSNSLDNSDFFTGAFPAGYTNAVSGVFDMRIRNGNPFKYQNTFQAGALGVEVASEGPLVKQKDHSYLFNYRYSTLGLVQWLLPPEAEKITYQDMTFKLRFKTGQKSTISIWGIGLQDRSGQKAELDSTRWKYETDRQEGAPVQFMAATGVTHNWLPGKSTSIITRLAATINGLDWDVKQLDSNLTLQPLNSIRYNYLNLVLASDLTHRLPAGQVIQAGARVTGLGYDMFLQDAGYPGNSLVTVVDEQGNSVLVTGYLAGSWQVLPALKLSGGFSMMWFTLNGEYSIEPRISAKWSLDDRNALSLGYGKHSRIERLNYYFTTGITAGEQWNNRHLGLMHAHHIVGGFTHRWSENLIMKIEPYWQWLDEVPVMPGSSFSFINLENEWFFSDRLVNSGKGSNRGIDVTLEKYLSSGYYFMATASIFKSEYYGGDKVWRSTTFDRGYILNALGGYEWQTGSSKQDQFGINLRLNLLGGEPYTPLDDEATEAEKSPVYDASIAYSEKNKPVLAGHFTATYRLNRKGAAHEFALKILNFTGAKDFFGFRYNEQTGMAEKHLEALMIPNISYRISF